MAGTTPAMATEHRILPPMDILTIAFLAGVGVIAGIIAAIVGGAAVVIYPALIATGVPPHLAAVSNLASVMPGTMLAALSDRSQLPPFDRAFVSLIFASIIGAGIGAVCLVLTPERVFAQIVPLLLGFATLLFAYSERIRRWRSPPERSEADWSAHTWRASSRETSFACWSSWWARH